VSAGLTIVTFVRDVGGPVQFLVEVAFFGFACYIAAIVVVPALTMLLGGLERAAKRQTTDVAVGLVVGVGLLAGGALIRFGLFHPDVAQDLDGIGTAFGVAVGVAILCVPLVLMWYLRGSEPSSDT
jgi:hypothetical protein